MSIAGTMPNRAASKSDSPSLIARVRFCSGCRQNRSPMQFKGATGNCMQCVRRGK